MTRASSCKLKGERFRVGTRQKFLTLKLLRQWNWLPREAVNTLPLQMFKARLDRALNNLVKWKVAKRVD